MLNRANLPPQSSSLPKSRSTGNGSIQSASKDQNRSRSNTTPEPLAGFARNALREDFEQVQAGMDQTPMAGFPVLPRKIAAGDHQVRFGGSVTLRQPLIQQSFISTGYERPTRGTVSYLWVLCPSYRSRFLVLQFAKIKKLVGRNCVTLLLFLFCATRQQFAADLPLQACVLLLAFGLMNANFGLRSPFAQFFPNIVASKAKPHQRLLHLDTAMKSNQRLKVLELF